MQRQSTVTSLALLALLGVGFAALGLLYAVNPAGSAWYPKCTLHSLTGLHCPGCGMLRGTHQLLQGNVAGALSMNALAMVLVPIVLATCLVNLARRSRHSQLPDQPLPRLLPDWTGWAIFTIVVVFTIARNIPYEPFLYLAPG
jgi:hypothetical protein